ncbi:hypothetical protein Cgig2_033087 [Carnegiea gigantea]|uniref:Uncharacterized protein n=1 Tax=Carnegiea gigantea TaxID=171969 RepID=A0A9Q1JJ58_9CARY|nr:hypothetical protein Cgig2_033087 [Carnegiea gigantea]
MEESFSKADKNKVKLTIQYQPLLPQPTPSSRSNLVGLLEGAGSNCGASTTSVVHITMLEKGSESGLTIDIFHRYDTSLPGSGLTIDVMGANSFIQVRPGRATRRGRIQLRKFGFTRSKSHNGTAADGLPGFITIRFEEPASSPYGGEYGSVKLLLTLSSPKPNEGLENDPNEYGNKDIARIQELDKEH